MEQVEVTSREALESWLAEHHRRADGVWLVTWKKRPGAPYLAYDEVVDALLCWGWIDSKARQVDDARTSRWIAPRRAGSGWSAVNKAKLERLQAEGRMRPPGLASVAAAKADGSWARLDAASTLALPDDLAAALEATPGARERWDRFPPSARRGILEWIDAAKRSETRAARVKETAMKAAENRKANFPAGRDAGPR